jgi:hypothetical protein
MRRQKMRAIGLIVGLVLAAGCVSAPASMDPMALRIDMSAPKPGFEAWKADYVRRLEAGSRVIETRLGPIEYSDMGEGVPVLSLHGTPGGYDQSLAARSNATWPNS